MARTVCASDYGGPGDPSSGSTGYHGDNLNGRMAFAELGMGTALGNLPYRAKVVITYNGRSVTAEKLDIGLGGNGCGGHPRAIDLWWQTAQALGFSGLAPVQVTLPNEPGGTKGTTALAGFGLPGLPGPEIPGESIPEELLEGKIPNPAKPLENLFKFPKQILDFFKFGIGLLKFLTSPSGWVRIGKVLLGLFLLLTGVLGMANVNAGETVIRTGKKAAEVAAVAAE